MIDINKLNQPLDLKQINVSNALSGLLSKQVVLLQLIVVIVGLVAIGVFWQGFMQKKNRIEQAKIKSQQKIELISQYRLAQDAINGLKKQLPSSLTEEDFVNVINDIAIKHHIIVDLYSEIRKEQFDYREELTQQIEIKAKSFKELMLFLDALEKEPRSIIIQRVSLSGLRDNNGVQAIVKLISVRYKDK